MFNFEAACLFRADLLLYYITSYTFTVPRCASLRPKLAPLQNSTPGPELSPSKSNRIKKVCANWVQDKDVDHNEEKTNEKHTKG